VARVILSTSRTVLCSSRTERETDTLEYVSVPRLRRGRLISTAGLVILTDDGVSTRDHRSRHELEKTYWAQVTGPVGRRDRASLRGSSWRREDAPRRVARSIPARRPARASIRERKKSHLLASVAIREGRTGRSAHDRRVATHAPAHPVSVGGGARHLMRECREERADESEGVRGPFRSKRGAIRETQLGRHLQLHPLHLRSLGSRENVAGWRVRICTERAFACRCRRSGHRPGDRRNHDLARDLWRTACTRRILASVIADRCG